MPTNCASMAYLSGDTELRRWDDQTHLLANCQDLLGMTYRVSWIAGQLKGKPPSFDPVVRPGVDAPTGKELMDPRAISVLEMFAPGAEAVSIVVDETNHQPEQHTTR